MHLPRPTWFRTSPPLLTAPLRRPTSHLSSFPSSFILNFRPKRCHVFGPCSFLKETMKQTTSKVSNIPQNLRIDNPKNDGNDKDHGSGVVPQEGEIAVKGTLLADLLLVGIVGGFGTIGYIYRDQISF